jgi:hypothetical protein
MSLQDVINYEFAAVNYQLFKAQVSKSDPGVGALLFSMATRCRELYESMTPEERASVTSPGDL